MTCRFLEKSIVYIRNTITYPIEKGMNMPRNRRLNRNSTLLHVLGWVGELSDEKTGIQPEGATQSMISSYSRFSQPHVSVVLKELERMRLIMLVAENHEHGRYSPKRYALTEKGEEMVAANLRLIEKIDAEVELAWLMDSQK